MQELEAAVRERWEAKSASVLSKCSQARWTSKRQRDTHFTSPSNNIGCPQLITHTVVCHASVRQRILKCNVSLVALGTCRVVLPWPTPFDSVYLSLGPLPSI